MPLRILVRYLPPPISTCSTCTIEEQSYDPTTVKPTVATGWDPTGGTDDTALAAMDPRSDTPAAAFASIMGELASAVANGQVVAGHGDNPFIAVVRPMAYFQEYVDSGPWPEMKRILASYEQFLYDNWGASNLNQTVQDWVRSQMWESPRTMLTIQEFMAGVVRWDNLVEVVRPVPPTRDTPLGDIDLSGIRTIDMPALQRVAHEVQRVVASGSLSLTQESQRWSYIASSFAGTPEGDKAQQIATYLGSRPLGADRSYYQQWATTNLGRSFNTMTDIEPLAARASQPPDGTPESRFAIELDRIANGTPGTRPVENTLWRQLANDIGPDTDAGLMALEIAGWLSASYDESNPARVAEYKAWAARMLGQSLATVSPPP